MSFLHTKAQVFINPDIPRRAAIDNIGVSKTDVWLVVGRQAFLDNPEMLAANIYNIKSQEIFNNKKLTEEEFNQYYSNSGIDYDQNMTGELAEYLLKRKKQRQIDEMIIAHGKGGLVEAVGKFGAAIVASTLSPTNIAMSFVPIGGAARWGRVFAKTGYGVTTAARGAVSSGVFQLGLEPAIAYSRHLERRDYTLAESLENIGVAATFGAGINLLGYGAFRLKNKLFRAGSGSDLHPIYKSGNAVVDREFRNIMDEVLTNNSHPEGIKAIQEWLPTDLPTLQQERLRLHDEYKNKLSEVFEAEHKVAEFEEKLCKEFYTDNPEKHVPDYLVKALQEEREKLAALKRELESNVEHQGEYANYLEQKAVLDAKISERLKYEQQEARAYDLSPEDLYIARKQLEEGKHINLEDPNNAESIYAPDSLSESIGHEEIVDNSVDYSTGNSANAKNNAANNAANTAKAARPPAFETAFAFIGQFKSKVIGFKEYFRTVDLRQRAIANEWLRGFMHDLEKGNLSLFFKEKNYRLAIAKELRNLTMVKGGGQGVTTSNKALEVAKIIHKWQRIAVDRANRAGADIEELAGYITKQEHSGLKMRESGYEAWRDFIMPLLDLEQTRDINLREVFNALATGIHDNNSDRQSRKLHFKSAESWLAYNDKYGVYNLSDSIVINLEKMGHMTGLLETMGDNPGTTFENLKETLLKDLRESGAANNKQVLKEIEHLNGNSLDNVFDVLTGNTTPVSPTLANISSSIRALKSSGSLGSVLVSSLPDMATWVSELRNNGMPILAAYGHLLKDVIASMVSSDRRKFAQSLGIATQSVLGQAYKKLDIGNSSLGWSSRLTNMFFKLNCMDWWDSSFKSSMGLVLSNNLAAHVHLEFGKLNPLLQRQLSRYGIDEGNWSLYKHMLQKEGGNNYLIPDGHVIPTEAIDTHLKKLDLEINDFNHQMTRQIVREDLSNNLRRYFLDRVDTAIATPGAIEKAFMFGGTKAGTWTGEFVRFFMQFKTFPIAYIMRPLNAVTLGRLDQKLRTGVFTKDMIEALKNPTTIGAMTHLLMGTTVLGYLSMAAKSILEGKDLPDPTDIKVWTAAVVKGGGLGIFGDFIFNEYDRYGRTFLTEAAGPVFGEINSLASIISKYKNGDITKAEDEGFKLLMRNIPGRNLFYVTPAITWMHSN